MCELLGAALIGGETVQPGNEWNGRAINNMLSIVIDVDAAHDRGAVLDEAEAYLDFVSASPLREGFDAVLMPGQPEQMARVERAEGFEVDDTTYAQLRGCAEKAGLDEAAIAAGRSLEVALVTVGENGSTSDMGGCIVSQFCRRRLLAPIHWQGGATPKSNRRSEPLTS